jgi:serine/threonine protein kinase
MYPTSASMPDVRNPPSGAYPRRFGPYVLLQPLGRGGMGQVSLAVTGVRGMETLCVVKRILPHLRSSREYVRRFGDEAELSRRLSHPNLVKTQAVGQIDGEPFIAQEFVEGHDLSEVSRRCSMDNVTLPIEIVVHILRELARGLDYAHDFEGLQLVHRDINPVNVRLTYTGDVKLLDFGLATSKAKTFFTEPGTNWGKRAFMAPEQLTDAPIDRRADVYVLGILLWETLTDQPMWTTITDGKVSPPMGDNAAAIERMLKANVTAPAAFNAEIPPELDRVVLKALARSPGERFQTAGELRTALAPFLPSNRDADVELAKLLARLFDVEKERQERKAAVAAAESLVRDEPLVPDDALRTSESIHRTDASGAVSTGHTYVRRRLDPRLLVGAAVGVLLAMGAGIALWPLNRWDEHRERLGSGQASLGQPRALSRSAPRLPAHSDPLAATRTPVQVSDGLAGSPDVDATAPSTAPPVPVRRARRPPSLPPDMAAPHVDSAKLTSDAVDAFRGHRFDEAVRLGQQAVRSGGGAPAHVVLGNVYLATRKLDEAEREYSDALTLSPHDAVTAERLAVVRQLRQRQLSGKP